MDKQEYREMLDEMKYEYEAGNYKKVIACANEVDIRKIREPRILEIISSAYENIGETEKARNALLGAYDPDNARKNVVYKLCDLSLQIGDVDEAVKFYRAFHEVAPKDNMQYILKYKIGRAGGIEIQQLINVLELYNSKEDDEKWKYELACLYHEAGDAEKCVSVCDDIFLWFGDGEYVKKALELKNSHTALSPSQQRKYEEMMQEFLKPEEMSPEIPIYDAEDDSIAEEFANEFLGGKTPEIEKAMLQESISLNGGVQEMEPVSEVTEEPDIRQKEYHEDEYEYEKETEPDEDDFVINSRAAQPIPVRNQGNNSEDTCVISLAAIRKELDAECGMTTEPEDEEPMDEPEEIVDDVPVILHDEEKEEPADEEDDLGITTRITLDELRAMLKKDNINLDDENPDEYDELDAETESEDIIPEVVPATAVPAAAAAMVTAVDEPEDLETEEMVANEMVNEAKEEEIAEVVSSVVVEGLAPSVLAKLGVSEVRKSSLSFQVTIPELGKKAADSGKQCGKKVCPVVRNTVNGVVDDADLSYLDIQKKQETKVQDPVAEERLKQIQQEVDIDSKVVLPYSMDDPSFENIEIEEYKKNESPADKAIETFDKKTVAIPEAEIENAELAALGASLADMMGEETDDGKVYEEYDNYEEPVQEPVKNERPRRAYLGNYKLPKHQREEMSEFLLIDGMEEQICSAIEQIVEDKRQGKRFGGNLVVTGDAKTGKTYLAIAIIKAIAEELESGDGKVAKVQAEALNGKSLSKVFSKIIGSDLVIENVGNLADRTIEDLIEILESGMLENMVVLEGNQLAVDNIFTNYPEMARFYDVRVDINELNILQWADLAIDYAREHGYELDDMAKLALHARISELNLPTTRLGYADVLDIMDDAIERANRRNVGKLFGAFKRNPDAKKEIIESDFD